MLHFGVVVWLIWPTINLGEGVGMPRLPVPGAIIDAVVPLESAPDVTQDMADTVEIVTQFETFVPIWQELAAAGAYYSGYQRPDWLEPWWDHIGCQAGGELFIVVIRQANGEPEAIVPLLKRHVGPVCVGSFLGGRHANFNLPVWRPRSLDEGPSLPQLMQDRLRGNRQSVDLLVLDNQPAQWRNCANPLIDSAQSAVEKTNHTAVRCRPTTRAC